jgi:hypothetical protein
MDGSKPKMSLIFFVLTFLSEKVNDQQLCDDIMQMTWLCDDGLFSFSLKKEKNS